MTSLERLNDLTEREMRVIDLLVREGELEKGVIAEKLGMKRTSLNNIILPMIRRGVIEEKSIAPSTGGRPPVIYGLPEQNYLIIGVDISILYVKVILADIRLNLLFEEEFFLTEEDVPDVVLDRIAQIIARIRANFDPTGEKILGVSIGSVSPVDAETGVLRENRDFLADGWKNINFKTSLGRRVDYDVSISNGVNCATLLEYLYYDQQRFQNIGFFDCGIGIRVGAMAAGQIVHSMNEEEEAFSKMQLLLADPEGNESCIEEYVTIKAIISAYLLRCGTQPTKRDLYDLALLRRISTEAELNHPIACEIIDRAADIMSIGISNFIRLLNSDLIVLMGPLIDNCPRYYDRCVQKVKRRLGTNKRVCFKRIEGPSREVIALGAALVLRETLLHNL